MSISDSLAVLRGVRDAIRDAIVGKGGSLPVGSPMESYAAAITNLPSSGGGGSVEIPFRSRLTVPGDTDPWHLTSLTATGVGLYAFYGDKLLTTADFPAVTSIGNYAFYGCSALTSVDLPVVTSLGDSAFQYCSALTSVDLPVVTNINTSAFRYCTSLTTADFPVATVVGTYAFQNCTSLTTVSLPAAISIGSYAFYGCSALTTADFPVATSISSSAFYGCSALTSLTLSKNQVATLSNTNAFTGTPIASGTGYVYVPDDLVGQYKAATVWAIYSDQILPLSQKP